METEFAKQVKAALELINGDPDNPSMKAITFAILLAKGVVTIEELNELERYFTK